MTMSERTFTITLTGPQYRELAGAVGERQMAVSKQQRDTLERAWNQIQAGWNRSAI